MVTSCKKALELGALDIIDIGLTYCDPLYRDVANHYSAVEPFYTPIGFFHRKKTFHVLQCFLLCGQVLKVTVLLLSVGYCQNIPFERSI